MRKYCVLIGILCLCLLPACGRASKVTEITGQIVEASDPSFVIRTDDGQELGLLLQDDTPVFSWINGYSARDFREGKLTGLVVAVSCTPSRDIVYSRAGKELETYAAAEVRMVGLLTRGVTALPDGTDIDQLWDGNYISYRLPDGTELLTVYDSYEATTEHIGAYPCLDALSGTARDNILDYYRAQGLLYNLPEELERAYAAYLEKGKDSFGAYRVSQRTMPTAVNKRILCFLTTVDLPIDETYYYELPHGAVFDRETGMRIPCWDLFSCTEQETKQTILDLAEIADSSLRAEMLAAFEPEYLIFHPDGLEVTFPPGSLPSQEHSYTLSLNYDQGLGDILLEWVTPFNSP